MPLFLPGGKYRNADGISKPAGQPRTRGQRPEPLFDPLLDEDAYLANGACEADDGTDLWENSFSAVLIIVAASGLLLALACPILIDSMLLRFASG